MVEEKRRRAPLSPLELEQMWDDHHFEQFVDSLPLTQRSTEEKPRRTYVLILASFSAPCATIEDDRKRISRAHCSASQAWSHVDDAGVTATSMIALAVVLAIVAVVAHDARAPHRVLARVKVAAPISDVG